MNIVHRFAVSASAVDVQLLARIGVAVPVSKTDAVVIKVSESDARFAAVMEWATDVRAVDLVWTEFTRSERSESDWLALRGNFNHGYPLPDDDFGYLQVTYDLADYCEECGTGARQIAPFRIKGEPKWGARSVMQLYWVYGEYFVTPSLYRAVFEPAGIARRVVLDRRERELQTVVQLDVPPSVDVSIEGLPAAPCSTCGRLKALPVARGYFPEPLAPLPDAQLIARTRQWFGSGHEGRTELLVAQALYRQLDARKVRGVDFLPCR